MAKIDTVQQRIERLETALAAMTSRAEKAEVSLTSERERHEREFAEVAAQSERFRQALIKEQEQHRQIWAEWATERDELQVRIQEIQSDLDSIARAVWLDKGTRFTYSVAAIVEWISEARKDTKLLEWWIAHSNAVLCNMDGKWAVYFGPQPYSVWCATPREAIDDAMAKTEKRKGAI